MTNRAHVDDLFETACAVEETGKYGFLQAGSVAEECSGILAAASEAQAGTHDDHLDHGDSGHVDAHGDHSDQ
jgi:hypothetical protein